MTAIETHLSILFGDAASLDLQLYELNELRDRVRQAELLARKSRRKRMDEGQVQAAL
jgi:hypothetical protein